MDPTIYNKFTGVWTRGAPPPPTPSSTTQVPNPDHDPSTSTTTTPKASHMNWIVPQPDISRGLFPANLDPNDPRSSVGWKEPSAAANGNVLDQNTKTKAKISPAFPFFRERSWSTLFNENGVVTEDTTPRAQETPLVYPYPTLSLARPNLNFDFRMSITLGDSIPVGSAAMGQQNWITFTGGSWSGPWGTGIVLPGGQDNQVIFSDGSTRLEAKFLIQTHETTPAFIKVSAKGWITGPSNILAKLVEIHLPPIDPSTYTFRLFVEMETADERYRENVNHGMWVGSAMKKTAEIVFDTYRVT